jgi:subtilisin-like proprotein convertase family protein
MRGSFEDAATSSIPDGGMLVRRTAVRGLATVDTDVLVRATLAHPRASQLRVTLSNPASAELVVFDGTAADDGHDVAIDTALPFSGDESVNGEWTLRVTDRATGETGTLEGWTLTVTSRWD